MQTPERGGPTAQAGIYFQNCVAALRLAHMLARTPGQNPRGDRDVVERVRVEAVEPVDDIVVRWSSGRREYLQVKLNLKLRSEAWSEFWASARKQFQKEEFGEMDAIVLATSYSPRAKELRTLLERAQESESCGEWSERTTKPQRRLRDAISEAAAPDDEDELLALCRTCGVWIHNFEGDPQGTDTFANEIDRVLKPVVNGNPPAFDLLLSMVAEASTKRSEFGADELWSMLEARDVQRSTYAPQPPPSQFTRLEPNPYAYGQPLRSPDLFYGRTSTLAVIEWTLERHRADTARTNAIMIYGPYRSGKSSVLHQARRLAQDEACLFLDVGPCDSGSNPTEIALTFSSITETALETAGLLVPPDVANADKSTPASKILINALRGIAAAFAGKRPVVLIDEVDAMTRAPEIAAALRSQIEAQRQLFFVLATKRDPRWSVDAPLSHLLNFVDDQLLVTVLSDEETCKLATEPVEGHFVYTGAALATACRMTGRYPCFAQILFHEIVEYRNSKGLSVIEDEHLPGIADDSVKSGDNHYHAFWIGFDRDCRTVMLTLAKRDKLQDLDALSSEAATLGLTLSNALRATSRLHRMGLISNPTDSFELQFELLAIWINQYSAEELFSDLKP